MKVQDRFEAATFLGGAARKGALRGEAPFPYALCYTGGALPTPVKPDKPAT